MPEMHSYEFLRNYLSCDLGAHRDPSTCLATGKSLDSPKKENVDKMSEKCRKSVRNMSKNCPEGLKTQFSDIFWTIFAYLVDASVW